MNVKKQLSIRIVKDEQLKCNSCLFSARHSHPELVWCKLNPKGVERDPSNYCGQGYWMLNGKVMDFKKAFEYLHGKEKEV